jgi:hypothetical protein
VPDPSDDTNATTADADGDGRNNILEYAFGGDPCRPDSAERNPVLTREPDGFRLTYGPITSDVLDAIDSSTDLSAGWAALDIIRTTNPTGVITALDPFAASPAKKFYRISVIAP